MLVGVKLQSTSMEHVRNTILFVTDCFVHPKLMTLLNSLITSFGYCCPFVLLKFISCLSGLSFGELMGVRVGICLYHLSFVLLYAGAK